MKRIGSVGTIALAVILFAGFAQAQDDVLIKTAPKPRGATSPVLKPAAPISVAVPAIEQDSKIDPDLTVAGAPSVEGLTTVNIGVPGGTLDPSDLADAFRVVVRFLQLSEDQAMTLRNLLQQRQQAVGPLLQMIGDKEAQIRNLLETGGSAQEIGQLVIEIHQLKQLVQQAQETFLAAVMDLLNPDQEQRWRAIHLADQLQPIVPAFKVLHLI